MTAPHDNTPAVRWGMMDAALSVVAPRAAARRYAARVAISNMRRGYDAAGQSRGNGGWKSSGMAADAEIAADGQYLRNRMRELVRNNPMAAQAVQVLVNNIVGTGIRPRAATSNPALNREVDALWKRWSARCDQHGHTDFHGVLGLAVREMIEGGDSFAIRRPVRVSAARDVPLRIELREAEHLDAGRFDNRDGGTRISQGIEYDRNGRRAAFWMFPDHPGDTAPIFARRLESVRLPADQVAHLFERQRVQSRGVPWGTPAMQAIHDVGDWQHAELVRKRTEACLVGIVFGADEDQQSIAPVVVDGHGNRIEQFEPGLIAYARGGKDIKFNQPTSTAGVYEWHRVQLHIIAAGFRVPYALMTGDLSQANFSSTRAGLNEFRRMVEQLQWQTVIPMFCEPIWRWFIDAAVMAGLLPEGVEITAEWGPPKFESVNPLQDATADMLEVRAGFSTVPQQIARRGYDPDELLAEWAGFAAKIDAAGLVFDSDPRKVTKAGLVQTTDPTSPGSGDDT